MIESVHDEHGIGIVNYDGAGYIVGSRVGGLKWLYGQARDKYVRTGSESAFADMLWFVEALDQVQSD